MRNGFLSTLSCCFLFVSSSSYAEMSKQVMDALGQGDMDGAFAIAEKEARTGQPEAQTTLGNLYKHGVGTEKDLNLANEWFEKAAKQGDVEARAILGDAKAQARFGYLLHTGTGVTQNWGMAAYWYRKAADQGVASARHNLAVLYESGLGGTTDILKAVALYQQAHSEGYENSRKALDRVAKSQFELSLKLRHARGEKRDPEKAQERLKLASDLGHTPAMVALAQSYKKGLMPSANNTKAVELLEQASSLGDSTAQLLLGEIYQMGRIVPKDYVRGKELYLASAASGNKFAAGSIGTRYRKGEYGFEKNPTLAAKWYIKGAAMGDLRAMTNLGNLFELGEGVPQDYSQAFEWYQKAVDSKYPSFSAYYNLGRMYDNGFGVRRDYSKAAEMYIKAGGESSGGNLKAKLRLASMFLQGFGVPQDYSAAAKIYEAAAIRGNAEARYNIGVLYKNGLGVQKDEEKALRYLQKAASDGNEQAQVVVAKFENTRKQHKSTGQLSSGEIFFNMIIKAIILDKSQPIDASGRASDFEREQKWIKSQMDMSMATVGASLLLLP